MTTPKAVVLALTALREERAPLAARVHAIDLVIEKLSSAYGLSGAAVAASERPAEAGQGRRRRKKARPARKASTRAARTQRPARSEGVDARRAELLAVIARAEHGITISELRAATPKMDGADRSQDLQALKLAGKIARAGNSWRAAA